MNKLWRLAAATLLVVTSFSMFGPVLAVLLQQRGLGTAAIGAFAMIGFVCISVLIPVMPQVFARFGIGKVYVLGMILESVCTLGYLVFMDLPDAFALWCACAVAGGLGAAAVWSATEALLAEHAPSDHRGHVMGLYQSALGAALAAGPFVPAALGWSARQTLSVAVGVQWVALGLAFGLKLTQGAHQASAPKHDTQIGSTWAAIRWAPALVWMAFVGGVFEAGLSSVSAAYAAGQGLSMAKALTLVGVLGAGSFALQYPAGWASDRFTPRRVFTAASVILLLACMGFAMSPSWPWLLYPTMFLWGGVGGALYTLSMIGVAHRFDASMGAQAMASGTTAVISGYALGGALGPLLSGLTLQYVGVEGLSALLICLSVGVFFANRFLNDFGR